MLLHRVPVLVFGVALALLSTFLWAPHVHLHASDGIRHAHLTPHERQGHDEEPAPHQDGKEDETVLDADAFLCTAALKIAPPPPVLMPGAPVLNIRVATNALIHADQSRAHSPPLRDLTVPRPPPAPTPAF